MVLKKGDYITLPCACCLEVWLQKKLVNIQIDSEEGQIILTLTHKCPKCGKYTNTGFKKVSGGPLNKEDGYQIGGLNH